MHATVLISKQTTLIYFYYVLQFRVTLSNYPKDPNYILGKSHTQTSTPPSATSSFTGFLAIQAPLSIKAKDQQTPNAHCLLGVQGPTIPETSYTQNQHPQHTIHHFTLLLLGQSNPNIFHFTTHT